MRPEYDKYWEARIWLHAEPTVALRRVARDVELEGHAAAVRLHTTRFSVGEQLYLNEVGQRTKPASSSTTPTSSTPSSNARNGGRARLPDQEHASESRSAVRS